MKGIILCGGEASRLKPLTKCTNKHLLPIYDKAMVEYPLKTLVDSGITQICIVLGGTNTGDFVRYLGDGSEYGANITYQFQGEAQGISQAINCCRDFIGDEKFAVILGDNIFSHDLKTMVDMFLELETVGSMILLKHHAHPEKFGVAKLEGLYCITEIVEKPKEFISNLVITGFYLFDKRFFEYFDQTKKSSRGEYEITDIIKLYNKDKILEFKTYPGFWSDAGNVDTLLYCGNHIANK